MTSLKSRIGNYFSNKVKAIKTEYYARKLAREVMYGSATDSSTEEKSNLGRTVLGVGAAAIAATTFFPQTVNAIPYTPKTKTEIIQVQKDKGGIIKDGVIKNKNLKRNYKISSTDSGEENYQLACAKKPEKPVPIKKKNKKQIKEINYTIKPGDTLSGISQDHNTTVERLMEDNPYIECKNEIFAGKHLKIKKSKSGLEKKVHGTHPDAVEENDNPLFKEAIPEEYGTWNDLGEMNVVNDTTLELELVGKDIGNIDEEEFADQLGAKYVGVQIKDKFIKHKVTKKEIESGKISFKTKKEVKKEDVRMYGVFAENKGKNEKGSVWLASVNHYAKSKCKEVKTPVKKTVAKKTIEKKTKAKIKKPVVKKTIEKKVTEVSEEKPTLIHKIKRLPGDFIPVGIKEKKTDRGYKIEKVRFTSYNDERDIIEKDVLTEFKEDKKDNEDIRLAAFTTTYEENINPEDIVEGDKRLFVVPGGSIHVEGLDEDGNVVPVEHDNLYYGEGQENIEIAGCVDCYYQELKHEKPVSPPKEKIKEMHKDKKTHIEKYVVGVESNAKVLGDNSLNTVKSATIGKDQINPDGSITKFGGQGFLESWLPPASGVIKSFIGNEKGEKGFKVFCQEDPLIWGPAYDSFAGTPEGKKGPGVVIDSMPNAIEEVFNMPENTITSGVDTIEDGALTIVNAGQTGLSSTAGIVAPETTHQVGAFIGRDILTPAINYTTSVSGGDAYFRVHSPEDRDGNISLPVLAYWMEDNGINKNLLFNQDTEFPIDVNLLTIEMLEEPRWGYHDGVIDWKVITKCRVVPETIGTLAVDWGLSNIGGGDGGNKPKPKPKCKVTIGNQ